MHSRQHSPPSASNEAREPQLLRFHLRHMFFAVTFFSIFCAVMVLTKGPWPLVIFSSFLLVGAHVMSTVIGTRLRDTSDDVTSWLLTQPDAHLERPRVSDRTLDQVREELPPRSPLATKQSVARWTSFFVIVGISVGLMGGAMAIGFTIGERIGLVGWLVGTISCGVLGAWLAFLASTFGAIVRHAWRDADQRSK